MNKTTSLDESTLADRSYRAYMMGRLSGTVSPESPVRSQLASRYAAPSRQPCEVYAYLYGVRATGCPIESPDELLGSVWRELGMPEPSQAVQ